MLSRLALRSVQGSKPCLSVIIRSNTTVAETSEKKNEVTFERRKRPIYPGKVRMGFLPEEWFQFFYPKTGVTGPYVFGVSFLAYLFSKEILVCEHEMWTGASLAIMVIYGVKKFGPKVAEAADKGIEAILQNMTDVREGSINNVKENIDWEKEQQWQQRGQTMLFDAKRENVGLQLETAYRQRLSHIHSQVKKRLDFQLETTNVKTRLEQRHMVNWVVDNVHKSITQAQETAALKQCLGDLKALAAKA